MGAWINEEDARRIRDDAHIAIDALEAIKKECSGGKAYTGYVQEKLQRVRRAYMFIESIVNEESEGKNDG